MLYFLHMQSRKQVHQNLPITINSIAQSFVVRASLLVVAFLFFGQPSSQNAEAQATINVTSCRDITTSGNYVLANNISSSGTCISIEGVVSNVTFDGNGRTITVSSGDAVDVFADTNSIQNITVRNFTSNGGVRIYGTGANGISIENVTVGGYAVYAADNTSMTNSTINGGVQIVELGTNNPRNPTFSGNTVTGSSDRLFKYSGDAHIFGNCDTTGFTITNNVITNSFSTTANNPVTVYLSCGQNGTFSNNTVNSTGQATGVLIRDGWSNNTFNNNIIHSNQSVDDGRGAISLVSGSSGGPPHYNTFAGNTVIADNSKALFHYIETYGSVYQNNLFISNSGVGSSYWDTTSTVGANRNIFSHNTFVNRGSGPAFHLLEGRGLRNTTFQDNIFQSDSTNIITGSLSGQLSGFIASNNIYHRRSGSVAFQGIGNFSSWVSASGDTNSLSTNPLFVNYSSGDYHLQSSSPARGAGTSGSDIGALPFSTVSCTESWSCGAWSSCSNSVQTRTCTDANACGTIVNRPALTQGCDSTAPTVSITAPSNGATVNGTVAISATASDSGGVAGVTFYANGVVIGSEDTSAPYSVNWNTTGIANGSTRSLTAVARDTANNTTTSTAVTVTINPPSCTESWTCGAWSACSAGTQTRTCTDANSCGTTNTRPPLSQSCISPDVIAPAATSNLSAR